MSAAEQSGETGALHGGLFELLQATFYAAGIKQADAAVEAGYTEKHVSQMLHGKAGTLTAWDTLIRAVVRLHDEQVLSAFTEAVARAVGQTLDDLADDWPEAQLTRHQAQEFIRSQPIATDRDSSTPPGVSP